MSLNPFKGIKKAFKKVGRSIKKAGSKIWRGVKNKIIKPIGKLVNKLGPLGMIAMSFVLPGLGTMLSGLWASAATVLPAGFVTAVNQGMAWITQAGSNLGTFVKESFGTITDKITTGLNNISGGGFDKLTTGAGNLWDSAKQAVGLGDKVPAGKLGETVGKKALEFKPIQSPLPSGTPGISAFPSVGDVAATQAREQAASSALSFTAPPATIGPATGTIPTAFTTPPPTVGPIAPVRPLASPITGAITPSAAPSVAQVAKSQELSKVATQAGKGSTLSKAIKAASAAFAGGGAAQDAGFAPFVSAGQDFDRVAASRFGIGGTGSAGGQFLDQSILAQIQAQSKRLEELG